MDFRGFDSSMILISRGGILMYTGSSPESSTQAIIAGMILVGRLGVHQTFKTAGVQTLFTISIRTIPNQRVSNLVSIYILQRGVQWKQGVVNYMMLYTILLYYYPNPLHPHSHCTPLCRVSSPNES